ncbi:hypothetical protein OK074_1846 [Actinobacteria bacterium OK074]|nr:hypothetical protein OK074_1846 [Actinobacteria bacterium OK074]
MPPPPPLARGRRRTAAAAFDPALDDAQLITARVSLTQGRWTAVRALLAATGDDWDRRAHRVSVLGAEPGALPWAHDWQIAEPESPSAALLRAFALVHHARAGKGHPETARAACRAAAALDPADPTPWFGLLLLERSLGSEEDVVRLFFDEIRRRYPDHHHAHHLMVARLAERRADAGPDPLHEVYDFADWAARQAPADSPLAMLPVVAHAERYRVLAGAGLEPADPAASGHWEGRRAGLVLRTAFDWWLEWEREDHPRRFVDLNFLAHAKFCEGHGAEAAALFQRIGDHVTPAPWSYPDRDPYTAFRTARARSLGAV